MKVNLLCSKRLLPHQLLYHRKEEDWAGIDRGALVLLEQGIKPVFSVGDFDSVNDEERHILKEQLNIRPVKAEKDDTDLALGVEQAVQCGYSDIHIFGATGGRLDHFMGVIQILQKPQYINQRIHFKVIDERNEIKLLNVGVHKVEKNSSYPYISLIPLCEDVVISLKDFKYNLNHEHLNVGSTLTISNEVESNTATIIVERGRVLQMRSSD